MAILFPNEIILQTEHFKVSQDWEVPIVGFFILATRRDLRSVGEFNEQEASEFGLIITKIRKGMQDVLHIDDVYLFQNEDTEHGFHLWMFPRHDWMEPFGRKIQSVRPIMEHAQSVEVTDVLINEVKVACSKMRDYFGKAQ